VTIRTVTDTHFLHNGAILKFECCDISNTESRFLQLEAFKPQNSRDLGVSGGIVILISFQDESLPRFGGVFLSDPVEPIASPRIALVRKARGGWGFSYYPKAQRRR
jgi:hypothetical protein